MKVSKRSAVSPFTVMEVMKSAYKLEKKGHSIIHMEVGQPTKGAPEKALTELANIMRSSPLGYTLALGLPELRERIAELYKSRYGLSIKSNRVIITSGSSGAFSLCFTGFFDPGDQVIIGDPSYPSYRNILKSLNLVPIQKPTKFEDGFRLTPEIIANTSAQGLLIASPANPTGSVLDRADLEKLIQHSKSKNMIVISDEIYHGINYNQRPVSALEIDDEVIVINSFSKYYSMTGWRIGWMVIPEKNIKTIENLAQNLFICPPHAGQVLGLSALKCSEELDQRVEEFKKNRDFLIKRLPSIGFSEIPFPDGAFYIYCSIKNFNIDSKVFCSELLYKTGVAITPGYDFDDLRGHQTVRFSYACSFEALLEAWDKLRWFCLSL